MAETLLFVGGPYHGRRNIATRDGEGFLKVAELDDRAPFAFARARAAEALDAASLAPTRTTFYRRERFALDDRRVVPIWLHESLPPNTYEARHTAYNALLDEATRLLGGEVRPA